MIKIPEDLLFIFFFPICCYLHYCGAFLMKVICKMAIYIYRLSYLNFDLRMSYNWPRLLDLKYIYALCCQLSLSLSIVRSPEINMAVSASSLYQRFTNTIDNPLVKQNAYFLKFFFAGEYTEAHLMFG